MIGNFLSKARQAIADFIKPKVEKHISVIFIELINEYPIITVVFKTDVEGVSIPEYLKKRDTCAFQYGRNLATPIPDLHVGEDGIRATLSFMGKPHPTFVPWTAVTAMGPGSPSPVGPGGSPTNILVLKGGKSIDMPTVNAEPLAAAA